MSKGVQRVPTCQPTGLTPSPCANNPEPRYFISVLLVVPRCWGVSPSVRTPRPGLRGARAQESAKMTMTHQLHR